jgi:SAM-dependent methyltransferase
MNRMTTERFMGAIGRLPLISAIVCNSSVRGVLERIPSAQALYGTGWERIHPFDRAHGTDTSGVVSAETLPLDEAARAHAVCYAGSQPSVLRQALAECAPVDSFTFVDLGCGKGRALLVASEFPFRGILGVELSAPLAGIASRNALIIARRFPQRPAISIAVADASTFALPAGNLVVFLYHPFGPELVAKVVANVEAALLDERRIYVVYYNPVARHCLDASPMLSRHYARELPYAAEELGYGPDESDTVVIWQDAAKRTP